MRASSKLIPPSLCQLEDISDIDSNSMSHVNLSTRKQVEQYHNQNTMNNVSQRQPTQIQIRINSPEGQETIDRGHNNQEHIVMNEQMTGYNSFKDYFTQEEIIDAFKAIDLNKDGYISKQDLSLYLEYINEPVTAEQIDEMVKIFNNDDSKGVIFQDFKKLASGQIIGLTNCLPEDYKLRKKQKILKNIQNSGLSLNPNNIEQLANSLREEAISIKKFKRT